MSDENLQPVFQIQRVYLKDVSLEQPNSPTIFLEQEAPNMEVAVDVGAEPLADGIFESTVTITVTAKIKDKIAFLVELQQAGIFRIQNLPQEAMEPALGVGCPNILFPYAREAMSSAVINAGFPPLILQPINFELMYMQQQQTKNQQPN